ncbi:PREDICTED: uncharacterized protein LOC109149952 [Ipomoea nil]|uniref:uncharacterized protein LOC109149952 n=1 Tax=Ipomoea nil TaxID=35883 RepID=UPI000900E47A|nr:PREDICTED: uncharacterized protein LOC109149952 [Ipomoea nil]
MSISSSQDERQSWFDRRLDEELKSTHHVGTRTIDMFIFPILHKGRYYMMSVSFKDGRFDVIDSSSASGTNKDLYDGAPQELNDLLSVYLDSKQQTLHAFRLASMKPKRMQMAWRNTTSTLDSAVFTMRHMESYTGKSCRNWDCGLQRRNSQQLLELRKRFMHNILLSEVNEQMQDIAYCVGQYDTQRLAQL